ncbi:hypothetical protein [Ammoniphilus sp. CFH 90114]|uniref:hypothetical protein n=1 Tax=Ammoniphilus sp. CFH 90114 TaxID=2493665 RepID=UPI00100FFB42|nr:hypothetical protein [Ammoniphilus sp. CFH 90114]RXT08055.1 hypothetical protein EIZ39_11635 [Ammoniphilus sp. CFH 90114]
MSDPTILITGLFATVFLAYKLGRKDKYLLLHSIFFGSAMMILLWQSLTASNVQPLFEYLMFTLITLSFLPLLVWFKKTKNIA